MRNINELMYGLSKSKFRSSFHLKKKDLEYIQSKGLNVIESHAKDFVDKRLAPEVIENDGKQTPFKGHPVFIAQHATACCCRGCLYKWHQIPQNKPLTEQEKNYIVQVIMAWIQKEVKQ